MAEEEEDYSSSSSDADGGIVLVPVPLRAIDLKSFSDDGEPKRFRTCNSPYVPERLEALEKGEVRVMEAEAFDKAYQALTPEDRAGKVRVGVPSRAGLEKLNASGSAQFSPASLAKLVAQLEAEGVQRGNVIIVDNREEPHGYVNGDCPVCLYAVQDAHSVGKSNKEVEEEEHAFLQELGSEKSVQVHKITGKMNGRPTKTTSQSIEVNGVASEQKVVADFGDIAYHRLPITDHRAFEDEDGDALRRFFDMTPSNVWVHFHCRGGKGRTTTSLLVWDMLHNALDHPELTFEDFVMRQWLLGGVNLLSELKDDDPNDRWKLTHKFKRGRILRDYLTYIRLPTVSGGCRVWWSTWAKQVKKAYTAKRILVEDES